ncbi:MAG: hypothetical protein JHC38_00340 [Thiotrichales bacterium]|jgi:hypothetical protein|nr:hypothetical protein [Thiotrichales bacterium]
MVQTTAKPHVLVLGGNFAGRASAQKIREYAGDSVDITVIDRKDYLLFVANIKTDGMAFIKTNLLMRKCEHPENFALDIGYMDADEANQTLQPVTFCIGYMGEGKAFYVRSNTWFGGKDEVLKMAQLTAEKVF